MARGKSRPEPDQVRMAAARLRAGASGPNGPFGDGQLLADALDEARVRVAELEAFVAKLDTAGAHDRGTSMIWCLVDNVHDDEPTTGPFDTYDAAAAHDPYDDRFEPRRITLAEWDARPGRRESSS